MRLMQGYNPKLGKDLSWPAACVPRNKTILGKSELILLKYQEFHDIELNIVYARVINCDGIYFKIIL